MSKVAIIGAGPAGMAAALKVHEIGAEPIIIEQSVETGGILNQCIHTGFGLHFFGKEISGPEYAQRLKNMLKDKNIEIYTETTVKSVVKRGKKFLIGAISPGKILHFDVKSIVFTTGAREKTRGMIMIPGFRGSGIYTAGLAQRIINIEGYLPGKKVVILGSGDVGLIIARRLLLEGSDVVAIVEIMPYVNGSYRNYYMCVKDYAIPIYLQHTVTFIHGKYRVEGVTISKVNNLYRPIQGTEKFIKCDTVLLSAGMVPENHLITSQLGADVCQKTGNLIVDEKRETTVCGVFAGGNNVQIHDLADEASKEAQIAGKFAALYSLGELKKSYKYVYVKAGENVKYVVPQRVRCGACNISIYFRVKYPMERGNVYVCNADGEIILSKIHTNIRPGEMITEIINNVVDKDILVGVESL